MKCVILLQIESLMTAHDCEISQSCQQNASPTDNGIDAGIRLHPRWSEYMPDTLVLDVGSYELYLTPSTTTPTNKSSVFSVTPLSCPKFRCFIRLPTDIQAAVCNPGLKLDDSLYNQFWPNGSWYAFLKSQHVDTHATIGFCRS